SEDIYEIERFISAMLAIREEISEIERGEIAVDQSALRNAPHTLEVATATQWDRPYSREKAISPMGNQVGLQRRAKYWPTVGRIDGAYGDRNLVCACEPVAQLAINR
ncbi:MAG: hypothetical protein RL287_227, partial [Actinomycetota bacterium]